MKEVFVWKSFGDVSVYSSTNPNLKAAIIQALKYEQAEVPEDATWSDLIDIIDGEIQSRSDSFEYGTGFYKIEEL